MSESGMPEQAMNEQASTPSLPEQAMNEQASELYHSTYGALRPSGHYLMLLIRAAMVDDGRGGPFLSIASNVGHGAPLYTHHISVAPVDMFSRRRLIMITGDEALAYAMRCAWSSVIEPTRAELYALGTWAVELHHTELWSQDYRAWMGVHCAPAQRLARVQNTADARIAAQSLRVAMARECLKTPTE